MPISFNSDEPSHFLVVRYISDHYELPPYTRDYYESAHPPLSDWIEAIYIKLWPRPIQAYALRFFSILIGLCVLALIYESAQLFVDAWSAAFAASFAGTMPMFVMFSASVTNDPITVLISTYALYLIARGLQRGFTKKQINVLCIVVGLAGITKYTCLGLVPIAIGAIIYDRRKQGQNWIVPAASAIASFLLLSGWWYLRNQIVYGDPFRSKAEAAMHMFNGSGAPTLPTYWIRVATMMTGSTLGLYPGSPNWPLAIYDTATAIFGIVLLAALIIALRRKWTPEKTALAAYAALVLLVVLAYQIDHFQAHGRLLYPAILPILLCIAGIRHVVEPKSRSFVAVASIAALAALTISIVLTTTFT